MRISFFYIISIFLLGLGTVKSQTSLVTFFNENYDSAYYDKLDNLLTARIFTGRKFSEFSISDNILNKSLNYNSNPESSVGLGLSYKWLGLNLGLGLKNPSDSLYGKTKGFDLQTQIYLRKLTLNIYSSVYNGFYLQNSNEMVVHYGLDSYYQRSDIKNLTLGINSYYIFNSSRYSNRATFIQNEWQKKTAGSFLAGANIFYNQIQGDSSLIPVQIRDTSFLGAYNYKSSGYFAIGGDFGYTLSLVYKKHWFFDFTILGGFTLGNSVIIEETKEKKAAIKTGLNLLNRVGVGYNNERIYFGINYTDMQANTPLPVEKMGYGFGIGNVKLILAYRFKLPEHKNIMPDWFPGSL